MSPSPRARPSALLIALTLALPSAAALAQPPPAPPAPPEAPEITLADLLQRQPAEDPRFAALEATIQAARAEVEAAGVLPNPTVSYDREEVFDDGQGYSDDFLRAGLPIELSGRRGLRRAAARATLAATEQQAEAARLALRAEATAAWLAAAASRDRLEALTQGRGAFAETVDRARRLVAGGEASAYDLERLEAELGAFDVRIARAAADLAADRVALGLVLGRPAPGLEAAGELAEGSPPEDVDALVAAALEARPDRRALRERRNRAERELEAARRAWIPDLVVSAGAKSSDLGDGTAWGYTAGVSVEVPLFDRGQADRARAQAALASLAAEEQVLERQITGQVRAAHATLIQRAALTRTFAEGRLPRLEALAARAEAAWREGERPIAELLDVHRTLVEARLDLLALRRAAAEARLDLFRATARSPR